VERVGWLLDRTYDTVTLFVGGGVLSGGWWWRKRRAGARSDEAGVLSRRPFPSRVFGYLISLPRRELVIADLREQLGNQAATIQRQRETIQYQATMLKEAQAELSADSSIWSSMEQYRAERSQRMRRRRTDRPNDSPPMSTPPSSDDGTDGSL